MPKTKPSVYIDTSVISYLVARPSRDPVVLGHQIITLDWWKEKFPRVRGFASAAVIAEASKGNTAEVGKRLAALANIQLLPGGAEVEALVGAYIEQRLIPDSSAYDALHLAYASFHAIDYLLTWNCRHLASGPVRKRVSAINVKLGRATPILCTPEELMEF